MEKVMITDLEDKEGLLDKMKTFGPLYVGTVKYYKNKDIPRFEIGTTQESEHPYRKGKCLIYRGYKSFTGRYLGVWVKNPRLNPEDDEAIDKLLYKALNQYDKPRNPINYGQMYRVTSSADFDSRHLVFSIKADTTLYVSEPSFSHWWDEYFGEPEYWKKLFASRCKEHEIAALLIKDDPTCKGWHLETFNVEEHIFEPVF